MAQQKEHQIIYLNYPNSAPISLLDNEVHIWRYFHKNPIEANEFYSNTLTPDEIERAKKYYHYKDRVRFLQDRKNLKEILAQYLGINPFDVRINYLENGKPYIENTKLEYNTSHSNNLSVYAITPELRIGIDIEKIREFKYKNQVIEHFFTKKETQKLKSKNGPDHTRDFFSIWTEKEAKAKVFGHGLSQIKPDKEEQPSYKVYNLTLHKDYTGALSHSIS